MNSTRRNFLSFLSATTLFSALPSFLRAKALQAKYLILVELRGANDGLNTVIPYTDKYYYRLRPNIAIPKKTILSITKNTGLHYRMEGVAKLFEKGECKIIQNLGYPNPVLSHFRSIELWEKGGDGENSKKSERGWLVDPISTIASKKNLDAKGIYLDNSGEIFSGDSGFLGPNVIDYEPEISEPRDATVPIPRNFSLGLLDKIVNLKKTNAEKLLKIKEKYDKIKWINTLGIGSLGSQLTNVCRLIEAEIDVPVFKVSIGSFDTHANQLATHELLLREFDRSIYATVEFLKSREVWDNTIIMTYSEFGRRAKENGSSGTDHGMAAPHFVLGGKIKGGIDGGRPNLSKLDKNNLVFSVDYRTLYDYVLSSHFGLSENPFKSYSNSIIS